MRPHVAVRSVNLFGSMHASEGYLDGVSGGSAGISAVTASRDRLARHGSIHGAKRSNALVGKMHTMTHIQYESATMRV